MSHLSLLVPTSGYPGSDPSLVCSLQPWPSASSPSFLYQATRGVCLKQKSTSAILLLQCPSYPHCPPNHVQAPQNLFSAGGLSRATSCDTLLSPPIHIHRNPELQCNSGTVPLYSISRNFPDPLLSAECPPCLHLADTSHNGLGCPSVTFLQPCKSPKAVCHSLDYPYLASSVMYLRGLDFLIWKVRTIMIPT